MLRVVESPEDRNAPSPLDEIARAGAREMLIRALQAEVAE